MAESARIGLVVLGVASLVFVLFDRGPASNSGGNAIFPALYTLRLLACVAGIAVCRYIGTTRSIVVALWLTGAVFSASSAWLGIIRGDYTSNAIISIGITTCAAAIIPWGWREQSVLVVVMMVGLIYDAAHVSGGNIGSIGTHVLLTILVTVGGSLYVTLRLDRARREIDRRQQEDEESIDRLTRDLEQRVHERTGELESVNADLKQANKELQGFTYSVSHDLRGALRVISGLSQLLTDEHGVGLDPAARRYADQIRSSTIRVGQLVDALLALARVSRSKLRIEPFDLSQAAVEIGALLGDRDPERRVTLVVEPGLRADGDPALLRTLLENLLENAWKFTAGTGDARIEVGAVGNPATREYFVRDNGAGFDMQYADKLFRPFERLHEAADFEGTGIGLATVQRVVLRHGGRVRAEGAEKSGATFWFTLPGVDPRSITD